MKTLILLSLLVHATSSAAETNSLGQEIYGFENSWAFVSANLTDRFGDKQSLYDGFMDQCRLAAGPKAAKYACDEGEQQRMRMNRVQPTGMRNYTKLGFAKIRAPEEVFSLISKFWEDNKHSPTIEWEEINTYHNMWAVPPKVVNIQDSSLPGAGGAVQRKIWESSRKVLEEWTGQHLAPCSMWGIRIYYNNSILTPHVDRNPLVTSAIINVAQDVDEDWPLEVWGHDGKPYNISMKPGDMVLYESHSIIHGRPFPMRGNFYANIFIHFEPIGALAFPPGTNISDVKLDEDCQECRRRGLPPYVIPDGVWEKDWRVSNPRGWQLLDSNAHMAAGAGDWRILQDIAIQNPSALHELDDNGWQPIHLATRAGHSDIVKYLLDAGADVNAITNHGTGYSLLRLANDNHDNEHGIFDILKSFGALDLGPEL